jgi:hypothetical protein
VQTQNYSTTSWLQSMTGDPIFHDLKVVSPWGLGDPTTIDTIFYELYFISVEMMFKTRDIMRWTWVYMYFHALDPILGKLDHIFYHLTVVVNNKEASLHDPLVHDPRFAVSLYELKMPLPTTSFFEITLVPHIFS